MTNLGDYIGCLLAEISTARMHADMESLRIADLYSGDPLLRHFPVPRFRLPNLTVDSPIAVIGTDPVKDTRDFRGRIDFRAMEKDFKGIFLSTLKDCGIGMKKDFEKKLAKDVLIPFFEKRRSEYLSKSLMETIDGITEASTEVVRAEEKAQGEGHKDDRLKKFSGLLGERLYEEFIGKWQPPPRIRVSAETAELRELGDPGLLTKIRLTVSEDALEWTSIRTEKKTEHRLIPE